MQRDPVPQSQEKRSPPAVPEKLKGKPDLVFAPDPASDGGALAFDDDAEFEAWATSRGHQQAVKKLHALAARGRAEKDKDHSADIQLHKDAYARVEKELRALAKRTGLPYPSAELLLRASVDRPIAEPVIFDPMLFHDLEEPSPGTTSGSSIRCPTWLVQLQ